MEWIKKKLKKILSLWDFNYFVDGFNTLKASAAFASFIILQDSEELLSFSRGDPPSVSASNLPWVQKQPLSPWLLIHFHGGGFVAQTSRSHEVRRLAISFRFPPRRMAYHLQLSVLNLLVSSFVSELSA